MIKTALSASLIALAVLAPAASAADEFKPPRQNVPAAETCRTPPADVDPKGPPAPRLSKAELEALAKLPLCSASAPVQTCVMVDQKAYDIETATPRTNGSAPPAWIQDYDECRLRQPGNRSGADGSYDGGRDRSLHTT